MKSIILNQISKKNIIIFLFYNLIYKFNNDKKKFINILYLTLLPKIINTNKILNIKNIIWLVISYKYNFIIKKDYYFSYLNQNTIKYVSKYPVFNNLYHNRNIHFFCNSIKTNIILYLPFIFIKYKNNILLPFTNKNYFNYFILNNIFLINANIISYITRFLINKEMFDNSYYIFDSFINIYCKLNHNFILLNNCSNESIMISLHYQVPNLQIY